MRPRRYHQRGDADGRREQQVVSHDTPPRPRGLLTLLLLLQKRERMTETLVCIRSSDVVRVASNDDKPRFRNEHLVGSRFLHRMHLAAVRGDDERRRGDALQDSLFGEIKFRHRLAETFDTLSIRPAEERVPVLHHLSRRVRTQPVALWNW